MTLYSSVQCSSFLFLIESVRNIRNYSLLEDIFEWEVKKTAVLFCLRDSIIRSEIVYYTGCSWKRPYLITIIIILIIIMSGGYHRWFKRNTRKKRPVTRDDNNNNNNNNNNRSRRRKSTMEPRNINREIPASKPNTNYKKDSEILLLLLLLLLLILSQAFFPWN